MADTLIAIGLPALVIALVVTVVYYAIYRHAPEPKRPLPAVRFAATALVIGAAAFVAGAAAGIAVGCAGDDAGNLCGLAGVIGAGPLVSALAVVLYAHVRTRAARQAP